MAIFRQIRRISGVSPIAWVSFIFLSVASIAGAAADYSIKLSRPNKAGDKYTVSVSASKKLRTDIKREGAANKTTDEQLDVSLIGNVEVLSVNERGKPTTFACTVSKLQSKDEAGVHDVLRAGAVIIAEWGWSAKKATYTLKDGNLPEDATDVLSLVLPLSNPSDPDDDDSFFGTTDRKRIGDRWEVAPGKLSKMLQRIGIPVAKGDISASCKVEAVKMDGSVECLELQIEVLAKDISGPTSNLPEWLSIDKGQFSYSATTLLPTDSALGAHSEAVILKGNSIISGRGPDGKSVQVQNDGIATSESKITYPKK